MAKSKKRNPTTLAGKKALDREVKRAMKGGHRVGKNNQIAKGNVKGETTPEQKEVVTLSRAMVTRYISQYAGFSPRQLQSLLNNNDTPMLERIIIQIILRAEKNADQWRLEFLLNRAVGKVKDEVEITQPDPYAGMTDEQLLTRRQELAERNLETLRAFTAAIQTTKQNQSQQVETPENVSTEAKAGPEGSAQGT